MRFNYDDEWSVYNTNYIIESDRLKRVHAEIWKFFDTMEKYGLQKREGQEDMMLDIGDAIAEQKNLMVEAGVGIGKSYAYIVPLIAFMKQFRRPVIVSTSTITLQEQLKGDIQQISDICKRPSRVVIAKGQSHYVCLRKVDDLKNKALKNRLHPLMQRIPNGHSIERLDLAEAKLSDDDWNAISISGFGKKYCRTCTRRGSCYFCIMRDKVKRNDNDFIVCNHDLLIAHLKKLADGKAPILADAPIVVIDEAHNLENIARNQLTLKCSLSDYDWAISQVRHAVKNFDGGLEQKAARIRSNMDTLFREIFSQVEIQRNDAKKDVDNGRFTYTKTDSISSQLRSIHTDLNRLSKTVDIRLRDNASQAQEAAADRLREMVDLFADAQNQADHVIWLESPTKGHRKLELTLCPVNISGWLNKNLYSSKGITILTSATLTSNSGSVKEMYQYSASSVGFPNKTGRFVEPKLSPFDYEHHALMYCADDLPHPSNAKEEFLVHACDRIVRLLDISKGSALILFTAKSDLQYVYDTLRARKIPYKIMRPEVGASQIDTLNEFRAEKNAVLLGTGVFWEGINLAGDALTNVIIFRLPFPVPDPIITAKTSMAKDGLMDVLVPEMIVKLKQGIGRLIRTEDDKGIISILDPRLSETYQSRYREVVFSSLPIKNRTSSLSELEKFYKNTVEG